MSNSLYLAKGLVLGCVTATSLYAINHDTSTKIPPPEAQQSVIAPAITPAKPNQPLMVFKHPIDAGLATSIYHSAIEQQLAAEQKKAESMILALDKARVDLAQKEKDLITKAEVAAKELQASIEYKQKLAMLPDTLAIFAATNTATKIAKDAQFSTPPPPNAPRGIDNIATSIAEGFEINAREVELKSKIKKAENEKAELLAKAELAEANRKAEAARIQELKGDIEELKAFQLETFKANPVPSKTETVEISSANDGVPVEETKLEKGLYLESLYDVLLGFEVDTKPHTLTAPKVKALGDQLIKAANLITVKDSGAALFAEKINYVDRDDEDMVIIYFSRTVSNDVELYEKYNGIAETVQKGLESGSYRKINVRLLPSAI